LHRGTLSSGLRTPVVAGGTCRGDNALHLLSGADRGGLDRVDTELRINAARQNCPAPGTVLANGRVSVGDIVERAVGDQCGGRGAVLHAVRCLSCLTEVSERCQEAVVFADEDVFVGGEFEQP
jgi:hypothetical protein